MKTRNKILLGLLILFVLIQFFRPDKNVSAAKQPYDIFNYYPASDTVKALVQAACYDCHSNNTEYPWYSNVQPLYWWMDLHVKEGKRKFNFSTYGDYGMRRATHKMDESIELMEEGEMPLKSYTWIHTGSRLNAEQQALIIAWFREVRKKAEKLNSH